MENKMDNIIMNITTSAFLILLGAMLIQVFELKIINILYVMYIVLFVLIVNFILKIAGER
jgi:E3 ubiquitin-protein ligase DOA10